MRQGGPGGPCGGVQRGPGRQGRLTSSRKCPGAGVRLGRVPSIRPDSGRERGLAARGRVTLLDQVEKLGRSLWLCEAAQCAAEPGAFRAPIGGTTSELPRTPPLFPAAVTTTCPSCTPRITRVRGTRQRHRQRPRAAAAHEPDARLAGSVSIRMINQRGVPEEPTLSTKGAEPALTGVHRGISPGASTVRLAVSPARASAGVRVRSRSRYSPPRIAAGPPPRSKHPPQVRFARGPGRGGGASPGATRSGVRR